MLAWFQGCLKLILLEKIKTTIMLIGLLFNQQNINKDHLISTWEHRHSDSHVLFKVLLFLKEITWGVNCSHVCYVLYRKPGLGLVYDNNNLGKSWISFLLPCWGCSNTHWMAAVRVCAFGKWGPVGSGPRVRKKERDVLDVATGQAFSVVTSNNLWPLLLC